ncbi:hypothetical protein DLJ53_25345 [Acuticoccus sediminis]|uniref:Uncharacterized protein n=1 Tax=Acuticoccus sediminis TaxID=2184697 RepID=A0A8B2NPU4_9HYPH|nr:hypothetical protein [Acuticoccus sediminis]RAH98958.1 hypothetical protein DLJ53_25345 [Acuticoccus sediminis]
MLKVLTGSALALALVVGTASDADAFSRKRTVTGPNGNTASYNADVNCAGGTCSRQSTRRGFYGNTVNRNGSVSCANGTCSGASYAEGPWHQGVSRSGSISRY